MDVTFNEKQYHSNIKIMQYWANLKIIKKFIHKFQWQISIQNKVNRKDNKSWPEICWIFYEIKY